MELHLHKAEYLLLCGFFSWQIDIRELWKNDEESKDLNIKKDIDISMHYFLSFKIIGYEGLPLGY